MSMMGCPGMGGGQGKGVMNQWVCYQEFISKINKSLKLFSVHIVRT